MKRLLVSFFLFLSLAATGQGISNINTRPPRLPDFSPSRIDPFSFSFQMDPAYSFNGPVVAELFSGPNLIYDSTQIQVVVNSNYVTVSFTADQIGAAPSVSQVYISWGTPRLRRLMAEVKPGIGGGSPITKTVNVGIIEVKTFGDTYNSQLAAIRAEAAVDTAQTRVQLAQNAADIAKIHQDSAAAAAAIAEAQSQLARSKANESAASAIQAQNAADAAIIQPGLYATEPLGRAAVADGQAFKVQGSGDFAALEYRRINSTSSTLIASYPSGSSFLSNETIGNSATSASGALNSDTNAYTDFSVFTKKSQLQKVNVLVSATGRFLLVQLRKYEPSTWMEVRRDTLTATVASTTTYNSIDVIGKNIQIEPGDAFAFKKIEAIIRSREGITDKAAKNFTEGADNIWDFTDSKFPNDKTGGVAGREIAMNLVASQNKVTQDNSDIALLKTKVFVVPSGFNWAQNLSGFAYTRMIVSGTHNLPVKVNLPNGIFLDCQADAHFNFTPINRIGTLDLTNWTTSGDAAVSSSTTFTTTSNGRVVKAVPLSKGNPYTIHIKGTTTATSLQVLDASSANTFISVSAGTFDVTVNILYLGDDSSITIKTGASSSGGATTTLEAFEVFDNAAFKSPVIYGDLTEKNYPTIRTSRGNYLIDGSNLAGMFKIDGGQIYMSSFFAGSTYPASFFNSFLRTKYIIDKNLTQTGYDFNTITATISDSTAKNYLGLTEGSSIDILDYVTLTNLYLYVTGDAVITGLKGKVVNGHIDLVNLYKRPLKFTYDVEETVDMVIDNMPPHPAVTNLTITPTIRGKFTQNIAGRTTLRFWALQDAIFERLDMYHPNYILGSTGQHIIAMSCVNAKVRDSKFHNGDSGFMFIMTYGPLVDGSANATAYVNWVETNSRALNFKGFDSNTFENITCFDMIEEGITFDGTDSNLPTLTMNRNKLKILSIKNTTQAVVYLYYLDKKNYNTMKGSVVMTPINEGKFGTFSKVVDIQRDVTDTDTTKFLLTASTDFFKTASVGDKYAVTYGFINNVFKDCKFINVSIPIQMYFYSFANTVDNMWVYGNNLLANGTASSGNSRALSYSPRRRRIYIAPNIGNVWRNSHFIGNGLLLIGLKANEYPAAGWVTSTPDTLDVNMTKMSDANTQVINNEFINTTVKIQGLNNVIWENNKLINTPVEMINNTGQIDTDYQGPELDIYKSDPAQRNASNTDRMLIYLVAKGNGSGYARYKIRVTSSITVRANGNAFLHDDQLGNGKSRIKTYSAGEISIYISCATGDGRISIDNSIRIVNFGETESAYVKYSSTNSPECFKQRIDAIPRSVKTIFQSDETFSANFKGALSNLPDSLLSLTVRDGGSMIEGSISDLPKNITTINLKFPVATSYSTVLRGDLKDLPLTCKYFQDETLGGQYIYTTRSWPAGMRKILIRTPTRTLWTSAMVDLLIKDLAATTWVGEKVIDLTGNLPNRTSASNADVTSLAAQGVIVLTD